MLETVVSLRSVATIIQSLKNISEAPVEPSAFEDWLKAEDALAFLRENANQDEIVVYASPGHTFIHAVLVPTKNVTPPDIDDLLAWNFNAYGSWGVSYSFTNRSSIEVVGPFDRGDGRTYAGGQKLIFPRSFEGRVGREGYWELFQPFAHVFGLHFLEERNAYCRLDQLGDIEDVVKIVSVPSSDEFGAGAAIIFRREVLDQWMALNDMVLVRTFDFTRYRASDFHGWSGTLDSIDRNDNDMHYRVTIEKGYGSFVRGCQIIRPSIRREDLMDEYGWPRKKEKEYETFIIQDWKNGVIREISCAPGATANYFVKSDLPFETSPAFFRPEVLQKYKADSDKYDFKDRSISCRGTWHLKTYDINEAGQVHTYIVYLADLPYAEQLHWKAYNEPPKAPISKRALTTDFEGRFHLEYDALRSLKQVLQDLISARVPWWTLRSEKALEQTHYPVTSSADEWADEILHLDQLVVEGFVERWLRKKAQDLGRAPDTTLRSLKLVEECLVALGHEEDHARAITAPLQEVHYLRSKVKGHAGGEEATEIKKQTLGTHGSYRKQYEAMCTRIDESMRTIRDAFKALR